MQKKWRRRLRRRRLAVSVKRGEDEGGERKSGEEKSGVGRGERKREKEEQSNGRGRKGKINDALGPWVLLFIQITSFHQIQFSF